MNPVEIKSPFRGQGYDYIITGAGCSGLSLIMHMIHSGGFENKKILLVDKEKKDQNDRTWCFWERSPGIFQPAVHHEWDNLWFHGPGFSEKLSIQPYRYKMIRGIDFYDYCFEKIRQQKNIEIITGHVDAMQTGERNARVTVDGKQFDATYIFNSILFEKPKLKKKEYWLLQHFTGWVIETEQALFDSAAATLMDFRVSQQQGTCFVYLMPFSAKKALVEYTVFSPGLLADHEYEKEISNYITEVLKISSYKITEKESGIIPMTNHRFPLADGNIIHIGTAGGQTRGSSGYTFQFIQKHSAAIVNKLLADETPEIRIHSSRSRFYDSVLLNILFHETVPGKKIFTRLFSKNKPQQVLRFLDGETTFSEELRIIASLPFLPFLKAAMRQL